MELLHRRDFRIGFSSLGPHGEVRATALMGLLEEAAGEHAGAWGLSVNDLRPRGLTWMISRYHLRILRAPRWGEGLEVATWPSGRTTMFATRDFEVSGAGGEPVAVATTSWVVIDLEQKKPVPVRQVVPEQFVLERRAFTDAFGALPKLEVSAHEVALPVMRRDLDLNAHVGHTVYVEWALEAVPREALKGARLLAVEVSYRAEANLGDRIVSAVDAGEAPGDGRSFRHRIAHAESGFELARLRTTWGR